MSITVKIDPNVTQPQAQIIPDATSLNDGVMTKAQAAKLDGLLSGDINQVQVDFTAQVQQHILNFAAPYFQGVDNPGNQSTDITLLYAPKLHVSTSAIGSWDLGDLASVPISPGVVGGNEIETLIPSEAGSLVWYRWMVGFTNAGAPTNSDWINLYGWNIDAGGGRVDASFPAMADEWSSRVQPGGVASSMRDVTFVGLDGVVYKPLSIAGDWNNPASVSILMEGAGASGSVGISAGTGQTGGRFGASGNDASLISGNGTFNATVGNSQVLMYTSGGPQRVGVDGTGVFIGGNVALDADNQTFGDATHRVADLFVKQLDSGAIEMKHVSSVADAGANIAFSYDTTVALTAGRDLVRWRNNTADKLIMDFAGSLVGVATQTVPFLGPNTQAVTLLSGATNAWAQVSESSGAALGYQSNAWGAGGAKIRGWFGGNEVLYCDGTDFALENAVFLRFAATEQTTVGAAGGASAPPLTPTKYFQVKDSAGATFVIPAYAPV